MGVLDERETEIATPVVRAVPVHLAQDSDFQIGHVDAPPPIFPTGGFASGVGAAIALLWSLGGTSTNNREEVYL